MHSIHINKQQLIGGIATVVVLCGVSFWGGTMYAKVGSPGRGQFAAQAGQGRFGSGNRLAGNGGAFGSVVSKDANSITIKLMGGPNATNAGQNGSGSRIVLFDSKTQVGEFTIGSTSDLQVGQSVSVNGTANADGSITAQMIQIRPAGSAPRGQ